jgi:hypothetical protein
MNICDFQVKMIMVIAISVAMIILHIFLTMIHSALSHLMKNKTQATRYTTLWMQYELIYGLPEQALPLRRRLTGDAAGCDDDDF